MSVAAAVHVVCVRVRVLVVRVLLPRVWVPVTSLSARPHVDHPGSLREMRLVSFPVHVKATAIANNTDAGANIHPRYQNKNIP